MNKELIYLRAAFNKARRWGYTKEAPEFTPLRKPQREIVYVPPDHFAALYEACEAARRPSAYVGITPGDYWRALLVVLYLTGMRINQVQLLRREDVDLDTGELFSRAEDSKGKRDVKVVLHPVILEHLRKLPGFSEYWFPWQRRDQRLYREFQRIQDAADVRPARKRYYGFHDLRRAFATLNADRMPAQALQRLMGHKDWGTTQKYVAEAKEMLARPENVFIPELRTGTG